MSFISKIPDVLPRGLLLREGIDVAPLVKQIEQHPELWNEYGLRRNTDVHADMSDIWVRYNDFANFDPQNPHMFNEKHIPVWYRAWSVLTELHPILFDLMAFVRGEMIGAVLITRIPPGGKILPHVDVSWHVDYYDKFYLALKSPKGVAFSFEDNVDIYPRVGDLHLIDNRKRHWVYNDSDEEKMTLIMCIRTQMFGRK
jgi:hypothetical protein